MADPYNDPDQGQSDEGQSVAIVDAAGNLAENWRDTVPENVRAEKCLETVTGWHSLISQFVNGQKAIGKKGVIVPTEKSSDAEREAFYEAIGRPKTADEYKAQVPEDLADILDEARVGAYRQWAHEHGVPAKLFEDFLQFEIEQTVALLEEDDQAIEQERLEAEQTLRKRFGAAYDERKHLADRLLSELRPNPTERLPILEKWGNDPDFISILSDAGSRLVESKALVAELTQQTPIEAEKKLEEIRATPGFILPDKDGKYLNDTNPALHQSLIRQQEEIIRQAFPPKKTG